MRLFAVLGLSLFAALVPAAAAGSDPVAVAPAPAATPDDGRSDFDRKIEDILENGEVQSMEDVGEGITHPHRVVIASGPVQVRAIFKTVDEEGSGVSRNSRVEMNFTDKYVYEAAAYRLDRLFHIGLVPPTVIRTIKGTRGSVQFWIEDATSLEKALAKEHRFRSPEALEQHYGATTVLDQLIFNIDRNGTNVLITPADDGYYLIDHSRSFRRDAKLNPFIKVWTFPVVPEIAERLRTVKDEDIERVLTGLVGKPLIQAVVKRRALLVKKLTEAKVM